MDVLTAEKMTKYGDINDPRDIYGVAVRKAIREGRIYELEQSIKRGNTECDYVMSFGAEAGQIEIVKMCKRYGATCYDRAMHQASMAAHIDVIKLCKEWGQPTLVMQ